MAICLKCKTVKNKKQLCLECSKLLKNCPDVIYICPKEIVGSCLKCWQAHA